MMLRLENITGGYNKDNPILKRIDLTVAENEVVAIVGQNGAGKSTLAKAIVNMIPYMEGNIYFNGELLNGKSIQKIVNKGVNYFMQGGRIFPHLTVEENLFFAGLGFSRTEFRKRKDEVMSYFDLFKDAGKSRLNLEASYLSGGEQHQLAMAMVLMKEPKVLILDEPSAGLTPINIRQVYQILNRIKEKKILSILLIEQNVEQAVNFGDRIFLLKEGKIVLEKKAKEMLNLKELYSFFFEQL